MCVSLRERERERDVTHFGGVGSGLLRFRGAVLSLPRAEPGQQRTQLGHGDGGVVAVTRQQVLQGRELDFAIARHGPAAERQQHKQQGQHSPSHCQLGAGITRPLDHDAQQHCLGGVGGGNGEEEGGRNTVNFSQRSFKDQPL